jgi:ATP-binding cassette subfamily C protein
MSKLTVKSVLSSLPKRERAKLLFLAGARVLANGFDILGLAGIALLASSFASLASGDQNAAVVEIPLLGQVVLSESQAVLLALVIVCLFLAKSFFAVWLGLLTNLSLANLEAYFVTLLTGRFFSNENETSGNVGDTVSRFQNNILMATSHIQTYLNSIISLLTESSFLIVMLAIFVLVNPVVAAALFVYMGVVIYALSKVVNFRVRRNSRLGFEGNETALNASRELFGVRREVQASGQLNRWLENIINGKRKAANSSAINGVLASLPRYVIETSLIVGIFAFLGGVVLFSDLSSQAVTIGIFLAGGLRLVSSVLPIQGAIQHMIGSATVAQHAFERIVEAQQKSESQSAVQEYFDPPFEANITFSHVEFAFPGNPDRVLDDVTFSIQANTKVAIVGPSGAGKTTTFELASGFRKQSSGEILISGHSPRDVLSLHPGYIGIVPQRPHLLTGTLAENISLEENSKTDMNRVELCLQLAGLEHFVDEQIFGLNRQVTPDFGEFSGGEIQRLGLARALYRGPKILFLDEATSALDAETESKVNQTLDKLRGNMTIVLIAHRLSTVMNADNIIYLDKGKVVAQGTFQELKAKVPDFAKAVELMDLRD